MLEDVYREMGHYIELENNNAFPKRPQKIKYVGKSIEETKKSEELVIDILIEHN